MPDETKSNATHELLRTYGNTFQLDVVSPKAKVALIYRYYRRDLVSSLNLPVWSSPKCHLRLNRELVLS